jgi:hypothetical protein
MMVEATISVAAWALAVSTICVACVSGVFAIRHVRRIRSIRTEISATVSRAASLRDQVLEVADLPPIVSEDVSLMRAVQRISRDYAHIKDGGDPLQIRLVQRYLEQTAEFVRMGSEGHLTIGADTAVARTFASILLDTMEAGDEMWLTSVVSSDLWAYESEYLRQQEEAISERGVQINRVFVFDTQDAYDGELAQQQIRRHLAAGVQVRYMINPRTTPRNLMVVRTRSPASHDARMDSGGDDLQETYAMECRVASDWRVDHIDLWSANERQSEAVKRAWWALQTTFAEASTVGS